jgi:hypothetical protein
LKERSATLPEARRPPEFNQRVMLHTGGRILTMHSVQPLTNHGMRAAEAGLNALLGDRCASLQRLPPLPGLHS